VLDELEELFGRQRADLEHGLTSEQATTEDLRQALGHYRSFFELCSRSKCSELPERASARNSPGSGGGRREPTDVRIHQQQE
jgi:hypothetical protein